MRLDKDGEEATNNMNLKKKSLIVLRFIIQIVCLMLLTTEI